jgi:hypothetical protein
MLNTPVSVVYRTRYRWVCHIVRSDCLHCFIPQVANPLPQWHGISVNQVHLFMGGKCAGQAERIWRREYFRKDWSVRLGLTFAGIRLWLGSRSVFGKLHTFRRRLHTFQKCSADHLMDLTEISNAPKQVNLPLFDKPLCDNGLTISAHAIGWRFGINFRKFAEFAHFLLDFLRNM